jgi:addiction module RelE/StbE family toxin
MEVIFHKKFQKSFAKQPKKIQDRFDEQFQLFLGDPHNPTLNNHTLVGQLSNYRSINIAGDIRAWYEVVSEQVVFMKIGSHSELYS